MDSLTQIVLGSAVSVAISGRRIGPRKAALLGAGLGTLPDLDVLIRHADPVSNFILHRSWSHSLLVHAVLTPVLGEIVTRAFKGLREHRVAAYATVFLCLTTHALLDAMTVYGTQLLWPLDKTPYGVGSIFIIDPFYTLPLLAVMIWALSVKSFGAGLKRATLGALALSTAYLGWSWTAQQIADTKARQALAEAGLKATSVLATPTPFNTLFWRTIALDGPVYYNIYQPLFAGIEAARIHIHRRLAPNGPCLDAIPGGRAIATFSKGYYRTQTDRDGLRIADLRMGLTPNFVFDFKIAERAGEDWKAILPERVRSDRSAPGDLAWLFSGMLGSRNDRAAEADSLFAPDAPMLSALPAKPECG